MKTQSRLCSKCGIEKPLNEFYNKKEGKYGKASYCKTCHSVKRKENYQRRREESNIRSKKYYEEHKDEIRKQQGKTSMYENRSCASYLGIVIAERLCRYLFKDVKVMPRNNTGYDIVCNKGKKIDVKAGCITFTGKNPRWIFNIDYNTTADFFILVAFDNRTDLNPLHLWMIPGKEFNENSSKSISPPRIHKWDKWKRDINDAQLCCTEIKEKKQEC